MTSQSIAVWWLTKDGDKTCLEMYERHYSCYRYRDGRKRSQFIGPGQTITLRTAWRFNPSGWQILDHAEDHILKIDDEDEGFDIMQAAKKQIRIEEDWLPSPFDDEEDEDDQLTDEEYQFAGVRF